MLIILKFDLFKILKKNRNYVIYNQLVITNIWLFYLVYSVDFKQPSSSSQVNLRGVGILQQDGLQHRFLICYLNPFLCNALDRKEMSIKIGTISPPIQLQRDTNLLKHELLNIFATMRFQKHKNKTCWTVSTQPCESSAQISNSSLENSCNFLAQ